MISSQTNSHNNLIPDTKNDENINENEFPNLLFQSNNNNYKNNKIHIKALNNTKKLPLKSIENIISNNITTINRTQANTAIKQSKVFLDNSKYKTITKQPNNNKFNLFDYPKEEKYSLLKMKKIKSNKFSPYKSTNHLYNKVENVFDEEKMDSKFSYFRLKKHKKIYSLKKAYISHISFKDRNDFYKEFKLFRDCDIGLNDGNKVKKQFDDFDVDSDDEVIQVGIERCMNNIRTAINLMDKKDEEYIGKYMKKFLSC